MTTPTVLDPALVADWRDAHSALAFDDRETNRLWEALARRRLGQCACGKTATHLLADEESPDWACRVPEATTAEVVHFWWVSETPDPSKPWSRALCDLEQESRFPEGSTGRMSPCWPNVTCPACQAAR